MMRINYRKAKSVVRTSVFVVASLFFMASCQEDEIVEAVEDAPTSAMAVETVSNIGSITIESANANFSDNVECSTCTYVVAENLETIDGKELGLAPGSVICLDAAKKYGNLTFVNVDGTEEAPITIGTCGN
jgi:hypothetical protein